MPPEIHPPRPAALPTRRRTLALLLGAVAVPLLRANPAAADVGGGDGGGGGAGGDASSGGGHHHHRKHRIVVAP